MTSSIVPSESYSQVSKPPPDDSMRVKYDDPQERAAMRQLMDLVTPEDRDETQENKSLAAPGSANEVTEGARKETPRRSLRNAGF